VTCDDGPVNVEELQEKLVLAGVRSDAYDLDLDGFSLPEARHCLRREGRFRWVTYFVERGERLGERAWVSEDEACDALLDEVLRDRGSRPPDAR